MTISYSAAGALSTGATSITPAYPSTPTAGELLVMVVASTHTDDSMPSTPSGWTLADSTSGTRRLSWFVRVAVGGDAAPTTEIPSGDSGSAIAGRIHVLARSGGTGWRWSATAGADASSGTSFSAAGSALTWAAGDVALLGYALSGSTASATAEAVAATGITYGATTERADDAVATGTGARLTVASCAVTAGSGSLAPTITATLAAAATGVAGVLRVREASATLDVSEQVAVPPRMLVSVTGMSADDTVLATVYRQVGTAQTAVRAATDVDVTGQDALLRIDSEQPFGVAYQYVAVLTDVTGAQWTIATGSFTTTSSTDVISDAVRGVGAPVTIKTWPTKSRTRNATVFNVNGRLVVVGRKRSGAQAVVTVSTETTEDGDALQDVLAGATEGIILVRHSTTHPGVDGYLALISDDERPLWFSPYREWDLTTAETEAWPDILEASGFTLQDLATAFPTTLQDLATAFTPGTLLDIALYDFGS